MQFLLSWLTAACASHDAAALYAAGDAPSRRSEPARGSEARRVDPMLARCNADNGMACERDGIAGRSGLSE
ncbi:hypothetical protein USDA257_c43140 [Sinorhizobium fredii USDA 257]|uniref:Uncharacterized protein n=1 Tax=Sinorhizobium fredii (strain USDA 257) TaxID=1185652 RepID=I3XAE7_SINF2|nr:hypothetical protein USDA257_c43140 [Sinorhizobium fredii USDA 257]